MRLRLPHTSRVPALSSVLRAALLIGSTLAAGGGALAAPAFGAVAHAELHLHKRALGAAEVAQRPRWACPEGACEAIIAPHPVAVADGFALATGGRALQGGGELGGFDPEDLRSAYDIPAGGGTGLTIALIDAFGYPDAESDLATYRKHYGLPACTTKNGCFEKVNEKGELGGYPAEEPDWDGEAALDEDMVSAACPECHILLVEGSGELPVQLGESANTAARLGASEISNSYGYPERIKGLCGAKGCTQFNPDYEHAGVLVFASAGDSGFDDAYEGIAPQTNFPASSPAVVAVGGTALFKKPKHKPRDWTETVWNEPEIAAATGGGCTRFQAKPSWQLDQGCTHRTDNDVAAVAAVETGVSVRLDREWQVFGGTSVASPLVAGIVAHASAAERALGAEAFYEDPGSLFDVTEGFNWDALNGSSECAPNEYLCNAEVGYDGPSGLGTPDGVPDETTAPVPAVTKLKPRSGPAKGGTTVTITGTGFTSAEEVTFGGAQATDVDVVSATGITATAPAGTAGTVVDVTVTTPGGTSAPSAKAQFTYAKSK